LPLLDGSYRPPSNLLVDPPSGTMTSRSTSSECEPALQERVSPQTTLPCFEYRTKLLLLSILIPLPIFRLLVPGRGPVHLDCIFSTNPKSWFVVFGHVILVPTCCLFSLVSPLHPQSGAVVSHNLLTQCPCFVLPCPLTFSSIPKISSEPFFNPHKRL